MKKIRLLVLLASFFSPVASYAVTVANLYQADLPVMSQSDDERKQAVRLGFQQLLIKLTGDPNIESNPAMKEAVSRANYFVEDVSYALPTPQSATFLLHVNYQATDINRLLTKSAITFWGEERPLIMVWLAVTDQKNTTEIIGDSSGGKILSLLKRQSDKYGLPMIYPLMDVTEINQVPVEAVVNMSLDALQQAGQRYSPNGYLVGKIMPVENGYESEWELIVEKNHWKWTLSNKAVKGIIVDAMAEASQTLAKHFALKA